MWEKDDIARSIRRYLGMMLESPWELRLERREVADDDRPVGVVDLGAAGSVFARTSIEQGWVTEMYPVTVTCYPEMEKNPRNGAQNARELTTALKNLIQLGMVLNFPSGRPAAGPYHIPLWDYTGVPMTGPQRAGPPDPHATLSVAESPFTARPIQDPEDEKRWTCILEFHVHVQKPGRTLDPDLPLVTTIEQMPGTSPEVS